MKHSFRFNLAAWCALTICTARIFANTGDNLEESYNPGFESMLMYWSGGGFINASADVANPGADVVSGALIADPGNSWNVIADTGGVIPATFSGSLAVSGTGYVVSTLARQNLKDTGSLDATAWLGLRQSDSANGTINYVWKAMTPSTNWHSEYLTVTGTNTNLAHLTIYLRNDPNSYSGTSWWDNLRLDAFPNVFASGSDSSIQVSLPSVVLNISGSTVSPSTLIPVVKIGDRFAGGVLSWQLSDNLSGTSVLQDVYGITQSGTWQWPIDVSHLSAGRYSLSVATVSADGFETGTITKPVAVISNISAMGTNTPSGVTTSTIDAYGRLIVNGSPFQIVMYYGVGTSATPYPEVRKLGGNTIQITSNSITTGTTNVARAWSNGLYSMVVLTQPPYTPSGTTLGASTVWNTGTLAAAVNVFKNMPGVIGYEIVDEPDGLGIPASQVRAAYSAIKSADPNRVIWVNLTNNKKLWSGTVSGTYTKCSDFASYDTYPFPLGNLSNVSQLNSDIVAFSSTSTSSLPLISVLQGFSAVGFPSFSQLRAELYTDVCNRMVHPFYYTWAADPYNSLKNKPEIRAYTQLLNWEMQQLMPDLSSTSGTLPVSVNNSNVKSIAIASGTNVLLVMVNQSDQPVAGVTATVSGTSFSNSGTAPVFPGTSMGTISGGQLTDSFPSYGVGVYRVH